MRVLATTVRVVLLLLSVLVIVWAMFDFGRRYYERWQARQEKPIELTILHWGDPAEDKIVAGLVESYQKQNPLVRITRINSGSDNFGTKLMTMMSAGQPPDIFYLRPDMLGMLADKRLVEPLDPYFKDEPAEWRDDFFPVLLDAMRFDVDTGIVGEGKLYGLPKDFTTAAFYINVDLFEAAGIDWKKIQQQGWTWPEFEEASRKIRTLNGKPGYEGREIYGTLIQTWSDTIIHMMQLFGGSTFDRTPDGKIDFANIAIDEPTALAGLEAIARMRIKDRTAFNATGIAKDGAQEFFIGNIGSTGPIGRWMTPRFKTIQNFKWDVVPVPVAAEPSSGIFYNGWGMSSASKQKDEAYKLIRFLTGKAGQIQQAREGLAIPALKSVAYSDDFLNPQGTGIPPHNSKAFLDAVANARPLQMPVDTQFFKRMLEESLNRAIQTGQDTPAVAAEKLQARWTREMSAPLRQQKWPTMPWGWIVGVVGGVVALIGLFLWWRASREKLGPLDAAVERSGFLFISPWIVGFVLLTLGPMIASLLLAFSQWSGLVPLAEAQYVGLANFKQLFTYDPNFKQSLKVTAYFVLLGVPVSQIAALAIALLMNSRVPGITVFRTIYFVPSVVSGAALAVLWLQLFNNDYGLINQILEPLLHGLGWNMLVFGTLFLIVGLFVARGQTRRADRGESFAPSAGIVPGMLLGVGLIVALVAIIMLVRGITGPNPPNWFGVDTTVDPPVNDAARWAIPGFVIMGLWGVGGGMIIYLAGLKGIPVSLYEAARIDGAGRIRQLWNVTLPMLSPLIFYNLVMAIIGSFQVFTQAYIMTGPGPDNATLFYVLELYRQAFEFNNMGYASAIAWILFLIVLVFTMIVFRGSKKLVYYEGLK